MPLWNLNLNRRRRLLNQSCVLIRMNLEFSTVFEQKHPHPLLLG